MGGWWPKFCQAGYRAHLRRWLLLVITTFSAVLNSTVALYSVDFHEQFVGKVKNHWRLGAVMSSIATVLAIIMVPVFTNAESIINLLQQLNGLSSMPILSAFIVGLLFRNVAARSAIAGVVWGIGLYALFTFNEGFADAIGIHYIDFMVVTLFTSVAAALAFNRFALGQRAKWLGLALFRGEDEQLPQA